MTGIILMIGLVCIVIMIAIQRRDNYRDVEDWDDYEYFNED